MNEDSSLMNPDHLEREIRDLEECTIPKADEAYVNSFDDLNRFIDIIRTQYDDRSNETITLPRSVIGDVIGMLSDRRQTAYVTKEMEKFHLRVLKHLKSDRRWIIGSKLKFLK